MRNKFEKTIFCILCKDTGEDDYLGTYDSIESAAKFGQVVSVAEYRLVKVHKVKTKVESS